MSYNEVHFTYFLFSTLGKPFHFRMDRDLCREILFPIGKNKTYNSVLKLAIWLRIYFGFNFFIISSSINGCDGAILLFLLFGGCRCRFWYRFRFFGSYFRYNFRLNFSFGRPVTVERRNKSLV